MRPASIIGHIREGAIEFLGAPDRPSDQRLREFYRGRRYLGSRDRREISRGYYQLIRRFRRYLPYVTDIDYDREIPPSETVPPVLALLLLQQSGLERDDIAEGCRLESSDLVALERLFSEAQASREDEMLSFNRGYPSWFVERLRIAFGEELPGLLSSLDDEADVGIRFDPDRVDRDELLRQLAEGGYADRLRQSEWTDLGLVMSERGVLSDLPAFRKGSAVVQDIGSQMISLAADPQPGSQVLDACAGAGGKTLHLADILHGTGRVVAHDAVPSRLDRLVERAGRTARKNVEVIYADEFSEREEELRESFDLVLVDAPCSGTGTFRRNPGLKLTLRPEDIAAAVELQREIIEKYANYVRPGGKLLYATCSLLPEENEGVIDWFLDNRDGEFSQGMIGAVPDSMKSGAAMVARPDLHGTDGFFAYMLRRSRFASAT